MVDHDKFTKEEAEQRLVAALRGARIAKPTPMKDLPRKRPSTQKPKAKRRKAAKGGSRMRD
jgi:hypothetical protein